MSSAQLVVICGVALPGLAARRCMATGTIELTVASVFGNGRAVAMHSARAGDVHGR
jgi:hypothetical protein